MYELSSNDIILLITTATYAADVTLAWDASLDSSVSGYFVHYGTTSHAYTEKLDTGSATVGTIEGLAAGETYYFAATAYATDNFESDYSSEVVWTATSTENTIPIANNTAFSTTEGVSVSGTLVGTDGNNDPLIFSIVTNGSFV